MVDQIVPIQPEMSDKFRRELELSFCLLRRLSDGVIPGASMSHWSADNPLPYFAMPGPVFINIAFRRGFLAEVHAPLAVLEKHLPALVRQHPITRVRVTDKEPWVGSEGGSFLWHDKRYYTDSDQEDDLPGELFELLENTVSGFYRNDPARLFPTAEAAHAALSEAMLRLAKNPAS